ncbi:MAG: hypothetical protein QXU87_09895 [Candidatus Caldarchaeum sp.]
MLILLRITTSWGLGVAGTISVVVRVTVILMVIYLVSVVNLNWVSVFVTLSVVGLSSVVICVSVTMLVVVSVVVRTWVLGGMARKPIPHRQPTQ